MEKMMPKYEISTDLIEHENNFISAVEKAHSSTGQKVMKAGALTLAALGAGLAFVLQGIWSVGGLRTKWFVSLPEYGMVRRIWRNMPMSDESAQQVMKAYDEVKKDLETTFKDYKFRGVSTSILETDPRYLSFEKLRGTTITISNLESMMYNPWTDLSKAAEYLKKAHELPK